jgi:endonuclease III
MRETIVKPRTASISDLLERLEKFYGHLEPSWPVDPYLFLVWWHCGYPASDAACERGWAALKSEIGVEPHELLRASQAKLAKALKAGGMVPEVRAMRLQQIAERVQKEFGGDLRAGLAGPLGNVRKLLKKFPGIADPGADRILLFGHGAPVAAVPSNCVHVLARIRSGQERENYSADYREAQSLIAAETADQFAPRQRAYLLLKEHGQSTCKRVNPKCDACPVRDYCAYFAGKSGGRSRPG